MVKINTTSLSHWQQNSGKITQGSLMVAFSSRSNMISLVKGTHMLFDKRESKYDRDDELRNHLR